MPDIENKDLRLLLENLLKNRKTMAKYKKFAGKALFPFSKYKFIRSYTPSDIISNIIDRLLHGKYHWNCEKCSFDSFMFFRIKTEVQNIIRHERKVPIVPLDYLLSDPMANFASEENDMDFRLSQELTHKSDLIFLDEDDGQDICLLEFKDIACSLFSKSPVEFSVLNELFKGKKPKEIAARLGIPKREVRNTAMRIRRTLITWCKLNNHQALLKKLTRPPKKNNRHSNRFGHKSK